MSRVPHAREAGGRPISPWYKPPPWTSATPWPSRFEGVAGALAERDIAGAVLTFAHAHILTRSFVICQEKKLFRPFLGTRAWT
jgi:hypothetical protein